MSRAFRVHVSYRTPAGHDSVYFSVDSTSYPPDTTQAFSLTAPQQMPPSFWEVHWTPAIYCFALALVIVGGLWLRHHAVTDTTTFALDDEDSTT